MKILLWKIGALGDIVMTTPLVRQLRRAHPGARIDYLTGHDCAPVLRGNPHLDTVHGFDAQILYARQPRRLGEILRLLHGYDCVFTMDKHWIFAVLARAARIRLRAGFRRRAHEGALLTHRVPYGPLRHEIDCYLDLAEAAGWPVDREDRRLEAPASEPFGLPTGATVLVNSGGANANEDSLVRRLPDALFGALVEACAARGPVVFLGGRAETGYYERFSSGRCTNLCGLTTLGQAVAVLRQAAGAITTDTGLMHIAAAVNRNVTAVFGPTHPLRKCPPGARWVWGDQERYDPRYEVFGSLPRGRYFDSLAVADILAPAGPSSSAAVSAAQPA